MKAKLIDFALSFNRKQRLTVELEGDFREKYDELSAVDVSIEIKKWREPRSKDANAYFHLLVNKIAEHQGLGNDEVKKNLVLEYGTLAKDDDGNTLGAMLPSSADMEDFYPYAKWYKSMEMDGKKYDCYLFYKRTHTLDTKEMSRLIDGTVYVAKNLGIDTDTPEQVARYMQEWQPSHGKE